VPQTLCAAPKFSRIPVQVFFGFDYVRVLFKPFPSAPSSTQVLLFSFLFGFFLLLAEESFRLPNLYENLLAIKRQ